MRCNESQKSQHLLDTLLQNRHTFAFKTLSKVIKIGLLSSVMGCALSSAAMAQTSSGDGVSEEPMIEAVQPEIPSMRLYLALPKEPLPNPLTLDYVLQALAIQSPQIFLQQAKIAAKQAAVLEQAASTSFELNLDGRLSRREFADEAQDHHMVAIHLGKQLYDFGYSQGFDKAAMQENDAELSMLNMVVDNHKLQVMQAFFNVILADFQFRIDNEAMAIEYIAFDKSKDRHAVGQISDVDLIKAESEYQQALLNRSKAEQNQFSRRLALANTLGYADARPDKLAMPKLAEFSALDVAQYSLESLYNELQANNPQLKRLKTLWQAQRERVDALQKANHPTIRADAWVGKLSSHPEVREGSWRTDLSLSMPLYDGGSQKSAVLQAQAKLLKLSAEHEALAQKLRQEIADVYFQLKLLKTEQDANRIFGDYADLYLDFSRALYENEQATDLGNSMVRLSEANYRVIAWRFKQALLWSKLNLLLGKPFMLQSDTSNGQ